MYNLFYPKTIFIENSIKNLKIVKDILNKTSSSKHIYINNINELSLFKPQNSNNLSLLLTRQIGKFLKPCPCTQKYIGCGYYFINLSTNCNIDCSYCILQGYLNRPFIEASTNLNDLFKELKNTFNTSNEKHFFRIGTGELTDSLFLDHILNYSTKLIDFFVKQKNAVLELKTKTLNITGLLNYKFKSKKDAKKIIISWSLNPDILINKEEKNAPNLLQRLKAAKKCASLGYLIGFHFDPIIYFKTWENEYLNVISKIFSYIKPEQIAWISLGTLRYPKNMETIIRNKYILNKKQISSIYLEEMIEGLDGKKRYFRSIREEIYTKMIDEILKHSNNLHVYLCMESKYMWSKVFKDNPLKNISLPKYLDNAIKSKW